MRNAVLVVMAFMLAGCAALGGISANNPKLQSAFQNAKAALNKARQVGVDENSPEEFTELSDRYNTLYQEHQNNPRLELVDQYQQFERRAYELSISTLQERFDRMDSRLTRLQNQLDKRVSTLEKKESDLKQQVQKLSNQNDQLKQDKNDLQEQIQNLTRNNEALKKKVENLRKQGNDLNQRLRESRNRVSQLKEKLKDRKQKLTELQKQNQEIQKELNQKLKEGDVRTEDESVYVSLESRILFGLGAVGVREEVRPVLDKIAKTLKKYPDREILVEGHTDNLPLKNELEEKYGSNWELSAHRAINVLKYLVYNQEIAKERIGAVAYGQFRPRVKNTTPEKREKNRRVEIVLLPSKVPEKTRELVGE